MPSALEVDARSDDWVPPGRPPNLRLWVEHAERRSIPVERWKGGRYTLGTLDARWGDPHILNRTPLDYPSEVNLERRRRSRVTCDVRLNLAPPASNDASVGVRMLPEARMWTLGDQRFEKSGVHGC